MSESPLAPTRAQPLRLLAQLLPAALCVVGALYGGWYHNSALIAGMCLLLSYSVQRLGSVWRWLPLVLAASLIGLSAHVHGLVFVEPPTLHAALLKVIGSLSTLLGLGLYAARHRDYQRERRALRRTLQAVNLGSERLTQARSPEQLWQVGADMLRELDVAPHFALLAYQPGQTAALPTHQVPNVSPQEMIILGAGGDFRPFLQSTLSSANPVQALLMLPGTQRRYWHTMTISGQQAQPFGLLLMARNKRPFDLSELTIVQAFVRLLGAQLGQTKALGELRAANDLTLRSLGAALEQRDNETSGHTMRVVNLSLQITRFLGWSEERIDAMRWGAYLHDLGKIAIPDAILHKKGQLNDEERAVMQSHTLQGCEMLRELPFLPPETLDVVRYHHERWDGQGYPAGLRGSAIPEVARLFSIVDVYDALTSNRPYKTAWSTDEALAELRQQSGKQFDPQYVEAFARLMQGNNPSNQTQTTQAQTNQTQALASQDVQERSA